MAYESKNNYNKSKEEPVEPQIVNGFEIPGDCFVRSKGTIFIRLSGLMFLANKMGIPRITTKFMAVDTNTHEQGYYCEASVKIAYYPHYLESLGITDLENYPFLDTLREPVIAHGNTTAENLTGLTVKFKWIMAETRAIVRALRFATGCAITAYDELDKSSQRDVEESLEDARKAGVTITSALDMAGASSVKDKVITLTQLQKNNKGAREVITAYLKEKSAFIVNNLKDDEINELYDRCKDYVKMVG